MLCFVDYRTTDLEIENLKKLNLTPIKIPKSDKLYKAIDGHSDIQLSIVDKKVILHKDIPKSFLEELNFYGVDYIVSDNSLDSTYPKDIFLNALITEDFIMHNLKFTDKNILNNFKGKKLIDVKQGYTRCSCLPINKNNFITTDKGIHNSLLKEGYNSLLLPPGDIELKPFEYGFIGGVGGMLNRNTLLLFGDLNSYKYKDLVLNFLKPLNIKIVSLKSGKLTDRGSLLIL